MKIPYVTLPNSIGSRIDTIIKFYRINLKEFSEKLNYSHSNISDIRLGKKPAIPRFIQAVCVTFGINEEWFKSGEGEMFAVKQPTSLNEDYHKIDIYSMAGAGKPNQLTETDPIDTIFLRKDFINEHIHVVVAKGDSMQPTIMDGAYVGVDIEDKEIVSGRVYALHFPYEGNVIKRITTGLDGIYVISDNADKVKYPTQKVLPHDVGEHFILGRVKWVIQKF